MNSSALAERPVSSAFDSADNRFAIPSRHVARTQRSAARRAPIVAAIDGSESGLAAVRAAARFARATVAPLVLVYVRTGPPAWLGRPYFQRRLDSEMEAAHRALAAADAVARDEGVHAESEVLEGRPARRISEFAGARGASMVVVGRRPRRFKKSVSRRVVREAARRARPVMVAAGA
jgi:nucleotide-binding universal stress UspA family protein